MPPQYDARRKLSPADIEKAKAMRGQGATLAAIGRHINCHPNTIHAHLDPEFHAKVKAGTKAWRESHPLTVAEHKTRYRDSSRRTWAKRQRLDEEWKVSNERAQAAYYAKLKADPVRWAKMCAYSREYQRKKRAAKNNDAKT